MRTRVVSVARSAAFPELPLAKAQNLTMRTGLLKRVGYTETSENKIGDKCFALEPFRVGGIRIKDCRESTSGVEE